MSKNSVQKRRQHVLAWLKVYIQQQDFSSWIHRCQQLCKDVWLKGLWVHSDVLFSGNCLTSFHSQRVQVQPVKPLEEIPDSSIYKPLNFQVFSWPINVYLFFQQEIIFFKSPLLSHFSKPVLFLILPNCQTSSAQRLCSV